MIVTTINKFGIHSVSLPRKATGQYWLYQTTEQSTARLVGVEGINDEWILKSGRRIRILDARGNPLRNSAISPRSIYVIAKGDEKTYVFTEPVTEDRQLFTKYLVEDGTELSIGRNELSDIAFDNLVVSSRHAALSFKGGKWFIKDETSTNGTYVNEKRVTSAELHTGDSVFVMGLKIIIGKDFVALNNPDGCVRVSDKLKKYEPQHEAPFDEDEEYEGPEPDYFYRSPRFKRDVTTATFKIDSPPTSPIADEMPWMLVMGSSVAMGMMSMVTLVTAISTGNVTSMVMGASMLVGTLLIPLITKIYERRRKRKKEALRQKKYKEYLAKIASQIDDACRLQEEILRENYITVRQCEERILNVERNLWERTMGQNDFLRVRVGVGSGLLDAEVSYQEKRFTIEDDNLQDELYALCEKPKVLNNIPITCSLYDNRVSGVIGERRRVVDFAKGLIIQLSALYSYDEVKFIFLYDQSESADFDFVKWLPHVWSEDDRFRFVAKNQNEVKEVSAYMESIIAARSELTDSDLEDVAPYFVIFSMSKDLATRAEMIKQVLSKKENIHISVVTFYDELKNLPKECSVVVELLNRGGRLFDKDDVSGQSIEFTPDISVTGNPLDLSVKLANTRLNTLAGGFKLPRMLTFLEMFGVGKVEHLNSLTRWKENDPAKSLEAPVGVDTLGETFKLDLHEKFHGPHGLVAGMTGSGKSEFIITYILSLAVNYHPNEVAFILIDYKGGGMAKSFEKLPHTAGIITNLDGAAIKRSLISIESELKRRQAIFAEASKKIGVSNIDIYKYQKLYREGSVSEPLQHLFIISDEFAELKTQQPEFMTQLVSAARIGRSLGVHLILATQKPSGVVDDQIWSNSKFRVCLKVQERSDSMDMLKRPDAAELKDTGRFYLQVGYNELFELGQSAWAGAPYYPSDKVMKEKDDSVVVIDTNGHPVKEVRIDRKRALYANAKKQLDVITAYLKKIADEEGIKIRPLWLDPIPPVILMDDLIKQYGDESVPFVLNPLIGEYDDPAHQRKCVFRLPISKEGNVVVYGVAGSGKTSMLNAMLYSLIREHTPEELNLYILDFSSETLRAFSRAPHVGDVILSYEAEKVGNLFKMLLGELEKRKKLFADFGGDYASFIKESGKTLPAILVAVNNFTAFTELYDEKEEAVSFLAREGTKYGIYFVLTSPGVGGVRFRLLQNFKQLLALQLNDESDYSSVVGKTDGLYPSRYRGRGLMKRDGLYEFQVASLTENELPFAFIREECQRLAAEWTGETAKKVPILPDVVDVDFLKDYIRPASPLSIPIGVEKNTLNVHCYPFGNSYVHLILSAEDEYKDFSSQLAVLIGKQINLPGIVFDPTGALNENTGSLQVVSSAKDCEDAIDRLFNLVVHRHNAFKEAREKNVPCEVFEQQAVLINSLSALKGLLGDRANQQLSLILDRGSAEYKLVILIADRCKAISSASYEKWYQSKISPSDGVWIGNGISEQYTMKANKTTAEMREELPPGFGFSLIRGKAVKIKYLSKKTLREEGDTDD